MRKVLLGLVVVLVVLVPAVPVGAGPTWPDRAEGSFTAAVDFETLSAQPLGDRCLLRVQGTLSFSGTLQGDATGTTTALVLGTCQDVASTPPGTFADVFRSTLVFTGDDGTEARITYAGTTAAGGDISAVMVLTGGLHGLLLVEAVVAEGGTYSGWLVLEAG